MNQLDIPKNIRQIGKGQNSPKIYVEDYVITYAKQLYRQNSHGETAGILLGTDTYEDNERYIFIWGLMELPDFHGIVEGRLSNETWAKIYTEVKENFTKVDIIGWFYCCNGTPLECTKELQSMHEMNFADGDRLFMRHDSDTRESAFYIQQMGEMVKQSGYYIFYKRNDEMYTYMDRRKKPVAHRLIEENVMSEEPQENRENIVAQEIKDEKDGEKKRSSKLGILVALAAVVFVIVALQNQKGFEGLRTGLNNVKQKIGGGAIGKEEETVTVETLAGNVTKAAVTTAPVSESVIEVKPQKQEAQTPAVVPTPVPKQKKQEKVVATRRPTSTPKPIKIAHTQYKVKKGDTLSSISEKFYHNAYYVTQIQEYNKLKKNEMIHVGQVLKIPKSL